MSTPPQPSPPVSSGSEASLLAHGPVNQGDAVDNYRRLGGLEEAVQTLKSTTKSQADKIEHLSQRASALPNLEKAVEQAVQALKATAESHADKIEDLSQWASSFPNLEKAIEKNSKDLNELGKRHDNDLHELERRLEKDVNELGRRHDKDIKELEKVAHTADKLVRISLGTLAAIVGPALIYLYRHVALVWVK
jgi:ABC-type transporter Mla subunit MlaD